MASSQGSGRMIVIGPAVGILAAILLLVGLYLFRRRSRFSSIPHLDTERGIKADDLLSSQDCESESGMPASSPFCPSRRASFVNAKVINPPERRSQRRWRVLRGRLVSARSTKSVPPASVNITQVDMEVTSKTLG